MYVFQTALKGFFAETVGHVRVGHIIFCYLGPQIFYFSFYLRQRIKSSFISFLDL